LFFIPALYAILSPGNEEAAFSNYDLWISLGFIVGFAYSFVLCTDLKIYVVLGILLLGMVAYLILEFRLRIRKHSLPPDNTKNDAEKQCCEVPVDGHDIST
jgi:hypothetical protein